LNVKQIENCQSINKKYKELPLKLHKSYQKFAELYNKQKKISKAK